MSAWVIARSKRRIQVAQDVLGGLGHRVWIIETEENALRVLDYTFPDIILLSSEIGKRDAAVNVLASLMSLPRPNTKVVFWAGYGEHDIALEARVFKPDFVWEMNEFQEQDINKILKPAFA